MALRIGKIEDTKPISDSQIKKVDLSYSQTVKCKQNQEKQSQAYYF